MNLITARVKRSFYTNRLALYTPSVTLISVTELHVIEHFQCRLQLHTELTSLCVIMAPTNTFSALSFIKERNTRVCFSFPLNNASGYFRVHLKDVCGLFHHSLYLPSYIPDCRVCGVKIGLGGLQIHVP